MPNTKSAIKRLRTNEQKHVRNIRRRARLNDAKKAFLKLIAAKDAEGAKAALDKCYSLLDRATKAAIISKNKASRDKHRLAAKLNSIQS